MAINKIPLFEALRSKMQWNEARQKLLAENVANAETPGYRGRDLKEFNFGEMVSKSRVNSISAVTTQPGHIAIGRTDGGRFNAQSMNSFEITPEGNGVTLEDEMMKVAANQMDFQAATSLYSRSVKLIRTALGR